MASGSYFTLYRKYNNIATDTEFDSLQKQYLNAYKEGTYSEKTDEEYLKDLPLVLDFNYGIHESSYDKVTKEWKDCKDYSIDSQRKQYLSLLTTDRTYLDEILTWHFCSGFTCLKDEWNLNAYLHAKSKFIIDKLLADKILQACNYLLSEKWSNDFELILNNEWIKIISSNNCSENYLRYVYRNNKKLLKDVVDSDEEDTAKYNIKHLQQVMQTFTSLDENYTSYGKTEHILVYTVW